MTGVDFMPTRVTNVQLFDANVTAAEVRQNYQKVQSHTRDRAMRRNCYTLLREPRGSTYRALVDYAVRKCTALLLVDLYGAPTGSSKSSTAVQPRPAAA